MLTCIFLFLIFILIFTNITCHLYTVSKYKGYNYFIEGPNKYDK